MPTPTPTTNRITIIDSIMGSGKTTWLINRLKGAKSVLFTDAPDQRFLVLTMYLDQIKAIKEKAPESDLRDPDADAKNKTRILQRLIESNENIATTHALFQIMNRETYSLLAQRNYHLVIDEALSCFRLFDAIKDADADILFSKNMVYIDESTGKLRWNDQDYSDYPEGGVFHRIRTFCENGNLVVYRPEAGGRKVLLWELPAEFLRCFNSVTIMTYLFEGSPLHAFLRSEGFTFDMKAVNNGELVEHSAADDAGIKAKLRSLVTVYTGDMNAIGKRRARENPLSSSWFKRADRPTYKALKSSTENFFKRIAATPAKLNMWTTFKERQKHLAGHGYARGFVQNSAKATNEFIEKRSLAYLCNIFHHPVIKGFFDQKGVGLDDDAHALSEMIQWVWRSQIRRGDSITVYIPSERMRRLFLNWLDADASA